MKPNIDIAAFIRLLRTAEKISSAANEPQPASLPLHYAIHATLIGELDADIRRARGAVEEWENTHQETK